MRIKARIFIALCGIAALAALTVSGWLAWRWLLADWTLAPSWLTAPNYWEFTLCWILLAVPCTALCSLVSDKTRL